MSKSRRNTSTPESVEAVEINDMTQEETFTQTMDAMDAEVTMIIEAPRKELSMTEKINLIQNLELLIEKRARMVQTLSELERFQVSSNNFNCSMRLNDSDGNVFTTSFTPGVKKVIDFLKSSFESSIQEVEKEITF